MELANIITKLENLAPNTDAEKWDNPGLLVDSTRDIKKVLLAVDASDYVVDTAIENGVDLIITHHPLIFTGLKQLRFNNFIGRRVLKLAANNIALYAMHTNFDVHQMNELVSSKLGITMDGLIEVVRDDSNEGTIGYGCYGKLINGDTLTAKELAELVKKQFKLEAVRVFGALDKKVNRIGIFPGSGKSSIDSAIDCAIDVLITGDIDHHTGIDGASMGMTIIDAGHYGVEKFFVESMEKYFSDNIPEIDIMAISDDEPFVTL